MVFNPFASAFPGQQGYVGISDPMQRPIDPFAFALEGAGTHTPAPADSGSNLFDGGQGSFGGGYGEGSSQTNPTQPGTGNPFGTSEGYGGPLGGIGGYSTPGTVLGLLTGAPLGLIGGGIDVYNDYGEAGGLNPNYSPGFGGWVSGIANEFTGGGWGTSHLDQATDALTDEFGYDRRGPRTRGGRRGGRDERDRGGPQGNSNDIRDSGSF